MISKLKMKNISKFGVDTDWNKAFQGKSKGNMHLFRVVRNVKVLCLNSKVDKSIAEAGAWLHDTGLVKGVSAPTLAYKKEVVRFLRKIKVGYDDIKKILHCIEAHDGRVKAKTLEAKIVHDADTLDKMGPLGIIRETWKRSAEGWTSERIANHLQSHLKKRMGKLYTKKAKSVAKKLNQKLKSFFQTLNKQVGGIAK